MRLRTITLLLAFLFAVSLIHEANAKVFKAEISLKEMLAKKHVYVGRFGFNVGAGDTVLTARWKKPIVIDHGDRWALLTFYGMFDEDLERHNQQPDVCLKSQPARHRFEISVPYDGTWSEPKKYIVKQFARTRLYHFFLQDCMNQFPVKKMQDLEDNTMEIIYDVKNSDGSELSQEENGLLMPHVVMTLVFLFFFSNTLFKIIKHYKKEEQMDYPLLVLDVACFLEFLALGMETLHLLTTIYFGESRFGTDFFSTMFSLLAQFTMTLLLIMIATGWSITYGRIEDLDLLLPLGALVAILHIIIGVVGKIADDNQSKMHDYDGWTGFILVIVRIVFFCVFVGFAVNTFNKAHKKIQSFVMRILLIGTVYLLTVPVVVTIATVFVDFLWRHYVITLGHMILQSVTVMLFAFQFTAKSSSYNSVSLKNSIFLPTNKAD